MTKPMTQYAREWEQNAAADALWVILTDSRYYGRKWNREEFFATGEEEIRRVFDYMHENGVTVPDGTFLDFGCGVGRLSKALRARFPAGYGVDISERMICFAREYVEGVSFRVNQEASLGWLANDTLDFVYTHIVLQHIPVPFQRSYIDEFLRVLKPGGLAVFQVPVEVIHPAENPPPLSIRIKRRVKDAFPWLVSAKRSLFPGNGACHEFRYEMHTLPHEEIDEICRQRKCLIEKYPATNSCDADHNGKVEFYDHAVHRQLLEQSPGTNLYLSRMYFVRKPRG